MKKMTDFIVRYRYIVLIVFIILAMFSLYLSKKVNINYDVSKYLPNTSEVRLGNEIMEEEFSSVDGSSLEVMFKGISAEEKQEIYDYLVTIDYVSSVNYDNSSSYNRDDYTLYVINVDDVSDSSNATSVYEEIANYYQDYEIYMSGDIYDQNNSVLPTKIVFLAIFCAMIILIVMCESYLEPFLFLFAIGMAVFLNNGTNIIFDNVSNITSSISAILQMALSMDYSIMLMNRYRQERQKDDDKASAMKKALYNAFKSISSSSVTTIVGLTMLVFMSFTIGRDLGLVLAKGVLFSLLSIFCCLPGLIVLFDNLIEKTKKKTLDIKLNGLGNFIYKFRKLAIIFFVIALIASFLLKSGLGILYVDGKSDEIKEVFTSDNQIAIIYSNEYEDIISEYCKELETNEKVNSVFCYGNTINEKLTYDAVQNKIFSLGTEMEIEEYLLKILYYDYYRGVSTDKLSISEFISFMNNKNLNSYEGIEQLNNFVYLDEINKKRSSVEIANILNIAEDDVEDIFIYYAMKNNFTKLTITEFVSFLKSNVLTNSEYSEQISSEMLDSINNLSKFIDKDIISEKMNSKEMASFFAMDEELVSNLYFYYVSVNGFSLKLSINEFPNFVLDNVSLDDETEEKVQMLSIYSDTTIINKEMQSNELATLFGIDESLVKQVMLLKYISDISSSKYSLKEIIDNILYLDANTNYLDDLDISVLKDLSIFTSVDGNEKLNCNELISLFGEDLVDMLYNYSYLPDNYELTSLEFINMILDNFSSYLDDNILDSLEIIKLIFEDEKYLSSEICQILGISKTDMNTIYALIDSYNDSLTISPYDFVSFIINNKDNVLIKNSVSENDLDSLTFVLLVMNNAKNKYSYQELSSVIDLDIETVKNVYILYSSVSLELTPQEFVSFLLEHHSDDALKDNLSSSTIKELKLLQEIMNSVLNDTQYSSKDLANLLGISNNKVSLIYGLYNYKNDSNKRMSLYDFVSLLISDIMDNSSYADKFDSNTKSRLRTLKVIMEGEINNLKYLQDELYTLLRSFNDGIDKDAISLLYLYYGSEKSYDDSWTLTIEELITYLNNNILKDSKFSSYVDKETIHDAYLSVEESKSLLVGTNYSRIILNSSYLLEDEETFDFIKDIRRSLDSDNRDIYVIGDSPMALDISLGFDDELNLITILTMMSIFIVVALTFKSFIIPLILVLVIQCAIHIIMSILFLSGENVYFISLLIVQSILMGATIDYAILYTSYYLENRKQLGVKEAIKESYNKSLHTILTSALILIIVTLIVGYFASATAAKICMTLSQGTICSTILILFLLPGIIAVNDRFIVKNNRLKDKNN